MPLGRILVPLEDIGAPREDLGALAALHALLLVLGGYGVSYEPVVKNMSCNMTHVHVMALSKPNQRA